MARPVVGLMLIRYAWVPLVGAVLGAGLSLGAYLTVAAKSPRYTASVRFQVVAPQPAIGSTENAPKQPARDDTSQIIHRQQLLFQGENFLQQVLKLEVFHVPPAGKTGNESAWLLEHKSDPAYYLKRDLVVVPRINESSFEVTMTAKDRTEAFNIVQAAVKVYMEQLQSDVASRQSAYLVRLKDAVTKAEATFQIKSDALLDYSKRKGIDVLHWRYETERSSLVALNDEYTRADAAASSAEQQYEALKKAKADGKEVQLSSDFALSVEDDSTLKALLAARLSWDQEKAVAETNPAAYAARLVEVGARLKKIDEQITETRRTLTADARERMAKMLQDEAANKRFHADYISRIRKAKEDIVNAMGQDMWDWQKRVDDLKEQQDLVAKLHSQYDLADANRATDDTRVEQIDQPVIPDKPSWPHWNTFLPEGAAGGFVLGLIFAGRLAWRRRGRDQAFPAT